MQQVGTLHDLFVHELADIYSAEQQITQALPKMAGAATSPELKQAFEKHLEQTRTQIQRLDEVFNLVGSGRQVEQCEAMKGLIKEGEKVLQETTTGPVKDAALIAAAQKVEHYEISAYGTARTHAEVLGLNDARDLLDRTLSEESKTDEMLTKLAEGGLLAEGINEQAKKRR